jgi:hypothetical protein
VTASIPVLGILAALGGCVPIGRVDPAKESRFLEPIPEDGKTTRAILLERYGPPQAEFDNGRILTWRFRTEGPTPVISLEPLNEARKHQSLGTWSDHPYSLVVILDGDLVTRHSLVRVR